METKRSLAVIEVLFAVIAWGVSFIATKVALRDVAPVTVVWLRFTMGVMILGGAVIARRQLALPAWPDLAYFALVGFIGITFHQWLQSTGLRTAQATTSAWIVATTPIFMALLGWLALKEMLGWPAIIGIGLAVAGVLLVVTKGDLHSLYVDRAAMQGNLLVLISSPNWAVFSVLSRWGLKRHPATRMMFFVMGFGWLFTTLQFLSGPGFLDIGRLPLDGWIGVSFLGIFCSGLAYIFWYDALQLMPSAQAGAFVYLEPFVTTVAAALLLGESFAAVSMVGGAAILVGVWLVQFKAQENKA